MSKGRTRIYKAALQAALDEYKAARTAQGKLVMQRYILKNAIMALEKLLEGRESIGKVSGGEQPARDPSTHSK